MARKFEKYEILKNFVIGYFFIFFRVSVLGLRVINSFVGKNSVSSLQSGLFGNLKFHNFPHMAVFFIVFRDENIFNRKLFCVFLNIFSRQCVMFACY